MRVAAYIIDGFIIGIPMAIVIGIVSAAVMPGLMSGGQPSDDAAAGAIGIFVVIYLLMFVGIWLYEAMMLSSAAGGTVGKRVMGLRVVRGTDGSRLSFGRATGRFFAKAFITGIVPLGIGYMMAGFTDRKRALHDMIADTVVIKRQ
ncbi:MAG: RDD family protein [Alphaproteobacteria bacterium]|nr:RDD family protein [Alphaproteobacteria bacterium]